MLKGRLVRINFFLLAFLSFITFIVFQTTKQTYGVNDDVIIQSWLSGLYTGKPEMMIRGSATPKLTFGFIVSNLYKIFPNINWFTLIILFLVLLAWYLIGLVVFQNNSLLNILIYIVFSVSHLYWFIPSPTYTASTILFSSSVLFFLIQKDRKLSIVIFLAIIFSFSYLVRPESFLFGSIVMTPLFLYSMFFLKKISYNKIIVFILITLSIISFDSIVEKNYYKNNLEWQNYKKIEGLRYQIQANRPEELLMQDPLKYGWSVAEAKLFSQYLTIDKSAFNSNRYETLIDKTIAENDNQFNPIKFLQQGHAQLINSDVNWEWFNLSKLIPLSFVFFFMIFFPKIHQFFILSTISLGLLYLVMLYVALYLRQPERVQLSAIFLSILIPLFTYNTLIKEKINFQIELPKLMIGLIIFILIFSFSFQQIKYFDKKYSGANNVFWYLEKEFLNKFSKDSIFIGNASQFRNNWTNPYVITHEPIEDRIFTLGWHNFSPHWKLRGKKLGLNTDNLIHSLIHQKNTYFLSDKETFWHFKQFLIDNKYEFSNIKKIDVLEFVGNDYTVWKIME